MYEACGKPSAGAVVHVHAVDQVGLLRQGRLFLHLLLHFAFLFDVKHASHRSHCHAQFCGFQVWLKCRKLVYLKQIHFGKSFIFLVVWKKSCSTALFQVYTTFFYTTCCYVVL